VNIRVLKNVAVSGRGRLSILLDVFNLFNVDGIQYAGPEVTSYCASPVPMTCGFDGPSNPIFLKLVDGNGRYLLNNAPGEPRQVQLGVRFTF
jgi:hypothetical protein